MRIAYAQMKVAAGHPDINIKKILRLIDEARTQGADVVIFPELAVSGRMLGETLEQKAFEHDCWNYLMEIAKKSDEEFVIVLTGIEDFEHHVLIAQYGEFIDWEDYLGDLEIELKEDEFYSLGFLSDGAPCDNLDLCIRFNSAPFDFSKKFSSKKIAEGCPIIYIGCVGIQNTGKTIYTFDGASAVYNSRGEVVQRAEPFKECLNFVDLEKIDKMPAITLPEVSEAEKIYQAINFGVKEFLAQIGMKKVVIGVSGGIDSAVAAAIYVKVLGAENIYLVNMPSRFNSATTKNLSEKLANNLGCKYFVVPIQESVDWTVKQLENVGLNVSSFVKENIQARDRSARILAAIAASVGGGFTCNANKAESTVGYATLYGDEAGFLSALADLWKFQVYELARYLNDKIYGCEVIPQGIIDIVPSAELSTAQNVDEGKGDPIRYPYHDYLFRAFAERNLTPENILNWYSAGNLEKNIGCASGLVKKYFPTPKDFILDLERWWRQFTGMGVAKRIQSPPILAVTDFPYGSRAESQNGVHFTKKYLELKDKLLSR